MVGFDFTVGIPAAYAERAGITDFREALMQFGTGEWRDFYNVCTNRSDLGINRPFFPHSCRKKGP